MFSLAHALTAASVAVIACAPIVVTNDLCYDDPPRACTCPPGQVGIESCDMIERRYKPCECTTVSEPSICDSEPRGYALIPAGSFPRGAPAGEPGSDGSDRPQHNVRITRTFFMQLTEVTQQEWTEVMGTNPSFFDSCPGCPVERVRWHEALDFANALSRSCGLATCYPETEAERMGYELDLSCTGFRLPTDAEWEYAARAGSTARFYSGADAAPAGDCDTHLDAIAWYKCNEDQTTHSAGTRTPNAWGLYDVHGNVAEWVSDGFADYSAAAVDNPLGSPLSAAADRVFRGGHFSSPAGLCRAAHRTSSNGDRTLGVGLRLVRGGS